VSEMLLHRSILWVLEPRCGERVRNEEARTALFVVLLDFPRRGLPVQEM
jgi:hypothetical protein